MIPSPQPLPSRLCLCREAGRKSSSCLKNKSELAGCYRREWLACYVHREQNKDAYRARRPEVGQQSERQSLSVLESPSACSRKAAEQLCWRPWPRRWSIISVQGKGGSMKGSAKLAGWPSFGGLSQIVSIVPVRCQQSQSPWLQVTVFCTLEVPLPPP